MSPHSPLKISLLPVADVIRQLREIIKDFWYRNRQEKEKGDLEILRKMLELKSQFGAGDVHSEVVFIRIQVTENEAAVTKRLNHQSEGPKSPGSPDIQKPVTSERAARRKATQSHTQQITKPDREQASE